jgi:hypothetical protein
VPNNTTKDWLDSAGGLRYSFGFDCTVSIASIVSPFFHGYSLPQKHVTTCCTGTDVLICYSSIQLLCNNKKKHKRKYCHDKELISRFWWIYSPPEYGTIIFRMPPVCLYVLTGSLLVLEQVWWIFFIFGILRVYHGRVPSEHEHSSATSHQAPWKRVINFTEVLEVHTFHAQINLQVP